MEKVIEWIRLMKDYTDIIVAFSISSFDCIRFRNTAAAARTLFLCCVIGVATTIAAPSKTTTMSATAPPVSSAQSACQTGAYRSEKGDVVVMLPRQVRHFRYVFADGRWGNTGDANPHAYCSEGKVFVKQPDGAIEDWKQVPLRIMRTHFVSDGTTLSGMLVEPLNTKNKPPLLVQVHGSNNTGWINGGDEWGHEVYLFAAHGISTFVFDKRGTGESAGEFTMDFRRLAKDVVTASAEARRLAAGRFSRFGLFGNSQGGWVAPLAAREAKADFMVIGSAGVFSPIEEDAEQVFDELRSKGYKADVLARARTVTDATGAVRASNYTSGYERLAEVKQLYGKEPWFGEIKGEFTGGILKTGEDELRKFAGHNSLNIDWRHDATAVLRGLSLPTLWIRAEKDRESPMGVTEERLATLQKEGKPIKLVIFPNTDHAMMEFIESPDGKRRNFRFTDGYYRLMIDWIKGLLTPPYGKARFETPAG